MTSDSPHKMLGPSEDPSYPPLFRETKPTLATPLLPLSDPTIDLPLIDLQNITPTSLGEVCRDWGVFRLVNNEISPSLSILIQEEAKKLFSHPFELKQTQGFFPHPIYYFWDLPISIRTTGELNCVEGLRIPFNELQFGGTYNRDSHSDNSFRCLVEEFGVHLTQIKRALLKTLAAELKLEDGHGRLASYLDEPESTFIVHRYLCSASSEKNLGFHPHTDSTIFTILDQDEEGGLQICRNNKWFSIPPVPNTLIVFIGDMLQVISDGEYKSVEHRVLGRRSRERISMGYFTFPKNDVVINSSKYKPFTFKEYRAEMMEGYRKFGSKVGIEHFEIKDTQA